ncbi:MAG: hypothetical protein ACKOXM_07980 [Agromyces sp.]
MMMLENTFTWMSIGFAILTIAAKYLSLVAPESRDGQHSVIPASAPFSTWIGVIVVQGETLWSRPELMLFTGLLIASVLIAMKLISEWDAERVPRRAPVDLVW